MPTFGFETAREVGTDIVESLMEDAKTTTRWYTAVCMGRKSGALALGICKSAGGTLAVIPEEFGESKVSLERVADIIIGSIIKRRWMGHDHGVAIVAEGVVERLDEQALEGLKNLPRDQYGHIRISDLDVGDAVRGFVRQRLEALHIKATVVKKEIGYELRCAKPVAFDVEYARTLGYGAVRYLHERRLGRDDRVARRQGHAGRRCRTCSIPRPVASVCGRSTRRPRHTRSRANT